MARARDDSDPHHVSRCLWKQRRKRVDNSNYELYNSFMEITADASIFLSVVLDETDRDWIIEKTAGSNAVSPEILPYEIGNALIAVKRKGRLSDRDVLRAFDISQRIAVRLVPVKIHDAMRLALRFNIYAYDAYYLQCCIENKLSLFSLDRRMCDIARILEIAVVE